MTLYGTTSVHTILHDTIPSYINIIHHGSAFCNSLDNSTTKICAGARKKLRMNEPVIGLNAERFLADCAGTELFWFITKKGDVPCVPFRSEASIVIFLHYASDAKSEQL